MRTRTFLNTEITGFLREQLGNEQCNEHFYLAMASLAKDKGLLFLTDYFIDMASKEHSHFFIIYKYLLNAGIIITIPTIEEVEFEFELEDCNGLDLLTAAMSQQIKTTKCLTNLILKSTELKDAITQIIISDLLKTQIENENGTRVRLDIFNTANNDVVADQYISSI